MNNEISLLEMPIDSPESLDLLWAHFIATENEKVIARIASVLDWKDVTRQRLQTWLANVPSESWAEEPNSQYREMFIRCYFPINYEEGTIDGPVDLDLHVALLAHNGQLKFNQLPVHLTQDELFHLAMKSAALWSLTSMAQQNQVVARLCIDESKIPGGAARLHLANS